MDIEQVNSQQLTKRQTSRRQFIKLCGLTTLAASLPSLSLSVIAQEQSWAAYNKSIVIDGLSALFDYGINELSAETLAQFKRSGVTAVNATVPYPGDDFAAAKAKIAHVKQITALYPQHLRIVYNLDDILQAKAQGQIGIIIGFQSTEMFADDLSRIDYFAKQGARYMQLSYNGPSQYGSGGLVKHDTGLTELGRQAVAQIQNAKVLLDLSHSGKQTVADAIKAASKPLTLSHTGCNAVYQHPRNNDDTELKAIADKGGVVGIYLMPFLEGGDGEITAAAFMRHLNHAINVCGEDHVAIGSDQGILPVNDGPEYREMIRKDVERRKAAGISAPGESANRPPFIPQLNSIRRMELIAHYMQRSGHSDKVITKVLGSNLVNLYREVW
ncbi:peptidase M19, renal dipeptidase [Shewanella sp. WXL01]|uniref:Peptidase M19, renal dipeptidase n=1 Tax=Shewanella maritima TaxID=2520507 RepID=A0A411PEZ2_9GAMM|nr:MULTISPECIES: membrane dipeptidase [Shewanella]NKF49902.1 peptidase M19, renal dipeptidase [Shewanella sp. WXL01]QBF82038.1 peptidase M19, renal dipeptidase [Shewanella maritima]